MEDKDIVELYFQRSEKAIEATDEKYGKYCRKIAYNILYSDLDAEECVNDTYFNAWNAIPPQKPNVLSAFLGRITRNLALKKYAHSNAKKRKGETVSVISELDECIPSSESGDAVADEIALKEVVNSFFEDLTPTARIVFFQRYWYFLSVKEIALENSLTESNVKVILKRTREKFKTYLEKEGIVL